MKTGRAKTKIKKRWTENRHETNMKQDYKTNETLNFTSLTRENWRRREDMKTEQEKIKQRKYSLKSERKRENVNYMKEEEKKRREKGVERKRAKKQRKSYTQMTDRNKRQLKQKNEQERKRKMKTE